MKHLRLTNVERAELERMVIEGERLVDAFIKILKWRGLTTSGIVDALVKRRLVLFEDLGHIDWVRKIREMNVAG